MMNYVKKQSSNIGKYNNVILETLQKHNEAIQKILQRLTKVETRIDGVDKRLDRVEEKMATKEDIAVLTTRLDGVEKKMATKEDLALLETRIHRTLMWAMSIMVTILGVMVAIVGGVAIKLFFF